MNPMNMEMLQLNQQAVTRVYPFHKVKKEMRSINLETNSIRKETAKVNLQLIIGHLQPHTIIREMCSLNRQSITINQESVTINRTSIKGKKTFLKVNRMV